jgi:protein-L-isoaspartate(D-aspartate) O-methyltransferase
MINSITSPEEARYGMVEGQIRPNNVQDNRVIDAMSSVRREKFVPKSLAGVAYIDEDLEISEGRYIMEPMVFARMLDAVQVKEGEHVLDIACARGYSSAVFSILAESVVSLEEDEELVKLATDTLAAEDYNNVAVVQGDMTKGLKKQGPFDLIFIGGMVDEVRDELLAQLSENGRLLCILNEKGFGRVVLMTYKNNIKATRVLFDASIPALKSFSMKKTFLF